MKEKETVWEDGMKEQREKNMVWCDHDKISNLMAKKSFPMVGRDCTFPCEPPPF
jgi:hypothetical protein